VIRPLAAGLGMIGSTTTWLQRAFIAWFGIRGIGSIYYLMYAIQHGLPDDYARLLTELTLAAVAVSGGCTRVSRDAVHEPLQRHGDRVIR
jgi:NhaP-type Na+/H+ or K+/H+ antiporter